MGTFIRDEQRVARHEHFCGLCDQTITKGTQYVARTLKDGEIYTFKMHVECEYLTTAIPFACDDWETHDPSKDFYDEAREVWLDRLIDQKLPIHKLVHSTVDLSSLFLRAVRRPKKGWVELEEVFGVNRYVILRRNLKLA